MTTVANHEVRDGLIIDIETGEIVGIVAPDGGEILDKPEQPAVFTIDDEDKANWVLGRILKRDSAISAAAVTLTTIQDRIRKRSDEVLAALEAEPEVIEWRAIEANCEKIIARQQKEREGLVARFAYELKLFAQKVLAFQKARTVSLPFGSLSLRKVGGKLKIVDDSTFCNWALAHNRPECVKFSPLISKLDDRMTQALLDDPEARTIVGVEVEPVDDTLTINTGVAKP